MSITINKIIAPSPVTSRGQSTQLSSDPKGERIAYASGKSIFLRSIDEPSISKQYVGHTAQTTVARFSPSGFYVASGDVSGTIRVWDAVEAVNTKGEYRIISGRISDVAWDGDSQRVIGVGEGKERFGHCITADSGNSVGEISGHSKIINSVAMRPMRPMRAATGSDDMSTCFLTGPPFKFAGKNNDAHKGYVYGVAFSPDGSKLVSVGGDKKIVLYDGKTGEATGSVIDAAHTGSIFAVSWNKDSKRIVTASADKTVKIWDVEAGKAVQTWTMGDTIPDQQVGITWTPRADGTIISINLAGDLNYLNEGSTKPSRIVQGHNKTITAMATSPDPSSKTIWTGSFDGRVCARDMGTGEASVVTGTEHTGQIAGFAATPDKTYSVAWDDTLRQVSATTTSFAGAGTKLTSQPKGIASSGSTVYVACPDMITAHQGEKTLAETPLPYTPSSIAASATTLAVADANLIRIYTPTSTGSLSDTGTKLTQAQAAISTLSFSPDGKWLAAGNSSGKIIVYNTSSWTVETPRWGAHTARVTSIAWNEAGTHAVSGSLDTNIYVWSLGRPGDRVKAANAHKDGVTGVGWLGGGVVSTGGDAAVKLWEVGGLK